MATYKITVSELIEDSDKSYPDYKVKYEQIVAGDESLIAGIVKTVLTYITPIEPNIKKKGK